MTQAPLQDTRSAARQRRWRFDHHSLDAYHVALEAYVLGDALARQLPRGYGKLADQLKRALGSAFGVCRHL